MPKAGFPYPAAAVRISLVGTRPFYEKAVRRSILAVLLDGGTFAPEQYGTDERSLDPFNRAKAASLGAGHCSPVPFLLRRKSKPAYRAFMNQGREPALFVTFRATPDIGTLLPEIFDLGDRLAAAYEPLAGWVHVNHDDTRRLERTDWLMDSGSAFIRGGDVGIGGLGLRTYFGGRVVGRVGEDLLRALPPPCVITQTAWGGLVVDLDAPPWGTTAAAARKSWSAAMGHLRPTRFFAEATFARPRVFSWSPSESINLYKL